MDDLKINKLAGFLFGGMELGLDLDDTLDLLLRSKECNGILRGEYAYRVHFEGIEPAEKAFEGRRRSYAVKERSMYDSMVYQLLAEFIEYTHEEYSIAYKDIFNKMSISDFTENFSVVLGNYDDKLIRNYIL